MSHAPQSPQQEATKLIPPAKGMFHSNGHTLTAAEENFQKEVDSFPPKGGEIELGQ
jgi:hypothetical protein